MRRESRGLKFRVEHATPQNAPDGHGRPIGLVSKASLGCNGPIRRRQRTLQHLRELRGFATSTAAQHDSTLRDFLGRAALPDRALRTLSATDIENYIRLKGREVTRQTLQHVIAHLRAFLRYCEDRGDITPGLHCIDTPRTYRAELPPRALDWKLVPKLVNSVDRHSRAGWRDHAVLHLMAYYGLRASDVAALTLSSINWESRTLHVQQR